MKEENYVLSICIPTYNRANAVCRQISFFLKEKGMRNDIEILVSNNNSKDNTEDLILNNFSDANIKYMKNEYNIGVLGNIRKLLNAAKGEFVWIVGDDDIIVDGTLDKVMSILENEINISGVYINSSKDFEKSVVSSDEGSKETCKKLLRTIKGGFMFITSNIVRTYPIQNLVNDIDIKKEENLAIPILFQFIAATIPDSKLYLIIDKSIQNDSLNISWNEQRYCMLVRYVTHIFIKLGDFGYSEMECKKLIKEYYIGENKRIFLEILKHIKVDFKESMRDFLWYLKMFPWLTFCLVISLPVRSLYYLMFRKRRSLQDL